MKKNTLGFTISVTLLTLFVSLFAYLNTAYAADIKVKVNGSFVSFPDAKPFVDENNRTLIPVRFVSEALGAKVEWDKSEQEVNINQDNKEITLKINEKRIVVNGNVSSMDTVAIIKDSRTFVPIRFVAEALGATVNWISSTSTVDISTITTASKIVKTIPKSIISNGAVLFSSDGKPNFDNVDWFFDESGFTLDSYDQDSLNELKKAYKIVFPTEYEVVYLKTVSVINGNVGKIGVPDYQGTHDNKSIGIKKFENGTSIIIKGGAE